MKTSFKMIVCGLSLIGASVAISAPSMAAPLVIVSEFGHNTQVQNVGWRCGSRWHANRWGRCVPNGRPHYYRRGW